MSDPTRPTSVDCLGRTAASAQTSPPFPNSGSVAASPEPAGLEQTDADTLHLLSDADLEARMAILKGHLNKIRPFVRDQEKELKSQLRSLEEFERSAREASEDVRLCIAGQLEEERSRCRLLQETLLGQRRTLRTREELLARCQQVWQHRHGNGASEPLSGDAEPTGQASRGSGRFRSMVLGAVGYGLAIVAMGAAVILGTRTPEDTDNTSVPASEIVKALPVSVLSARPVESFTVQRDYTGEIISGRSSELGFERPGVLTRMNVDEGRQVRAGEVLAALDTRMLETEIRQTEAQLAQADARLRELRSGPRSETIAAAGAAANDLKEQLRLARTRLARRRGLYEQGAISRERFDEARSEVSILGARWQEAKSRLQELQAGTRDEQIDAQVAAIAQLQAQLDSLQLEREKSVLVAPFDGTVSERHANEGTVVSMGTPIFRLVEDAALEAHVGIPATVARSLPQGSLQQLEVGPNTYSARVDSILPELDPSTRTLTVILKLEGLAPERAFPGQLVRLQISENIGEAGFWLPTQALVQGVRGLWSCYVLGAPAIDSVPEDGTEPTFRVESRDVEILHVDGDRVLVRGTLQPGERIIASGVHRLVPSQWVRPTPAAAELSAVSPGEPEPRGE